MNLSKSSLLGVSVTTSSRQAILSRISRFLSVLRPPSSVLQIVTPNPEQIVLAQKNEEFRRILNDADVALPDGAGLVWAMNRRQISVLRPPSSVFRIPGRDFMVDLCRVSAVKNGRVLLYGGRGGVAKQALLELKKTFPNLDGIAMDGSEFSESAAIDPVIIDDLRRVIRSRNIRVIFLGLGAPKQEYLMDALRHTFKGTTLHGVYSNFVVMAVGGAFDMLAGKITRAPKLVQQMGFEWLWRLFQEPWRVKRQLALVQFVWLVFTKKIRDN